MKPKIAVRKNSFFLVVRYVDVDTTTIFEHFLSYTQATSLNAESLSSYIIETLYKHKLHPTKIVSQAYDGASVMSGCNSGVQQHMKQIAPQATYSTVL